MESYRTVKQETSAEFIEKRSKFIGYIKPVQTEEEAIAFIQSIKSKHWDATHNVYAYSLREGQTRRYSDDGEPQGTAGIPTLDVLQKADITDAVVVVTRYFGGILLEAEDWYALILMRLPWLLRQAVCCICANACWQN